MGQSSFVDRVVMHAVAGDGGHGCSSVHREKFKPLGGPDGGDGGRGGDVVLTVDGGTATLLDVRHHPHRRAGSGRPGQGSHRAGADGDDVVVVVPDGTAVKAEDGTVLVDLVGQGARHVLCRGGRGGRGNASLAGTRRKVPGFAELGEPGEALDVVLELKSVADVALVGYPSAGKSSLVGAMSAAKPKIADYPFTTLVPNLGVVSAGEEVFTVADVPGLIPGASEGRGLGLDFLRHVERCSVLVHVLDCATLEPGRDPLTDLDVIEAELAAYGGLADRPRLIALNKTDIPEGRDLAELVRPELEARGLSVHLVSAVSRDGLRALSFALGAKVVAARAASPLEPTRLVLRPRGVGQVEFVVSPDPEGGWRVEGATPLRWVRQTDFSNDEAAGWLGDRLERLGVEKELVRLGAQGGDPVTIGPMTFDFEPAVADLTLGPRGSDDRVDPLLRVGAAARLAAKKGRRRGDPDAGPDDDDPAQG